MVLKQVIVRTANGDFVGETPNNDGCVVVVLGYEFLHLRNGVLATCGHMTGNVGDFCPNDETALVAKIIEVLIVLVVSQTNGGSTHFANEVHIFFVVLGEQSVTKAPSILVTGYTAQGVFLTVEDKAVIGINLKGTATKTAAYVIKNVAIFYDFNLAAVEVGILATVPQVNVLQGEVYSGFGAFNLCDFVFFLIVNGVNQLLCRSYVLNEYLNFNVCVLAVNGGGDHKTGAAVVVKVEVRLVNSNEVYVTVDTTVEGEVCHLGVNGFVYGVFNNNSDFGLVCYLFGDVYSPGGVTAIMVREFFAANVNVGRGVSAAQLKVVEVCCRQISLVQSFAVNAIATEVIIAAIHTVSGIPRVGKIYFFTLANSNISAVFYKQPILIQVDNVSHGIYSFQLWFEIVFLEGGSTNCSRRGNGELFPKIASDRQVDSRTPMLIMNYARLSLSSAEV